jgi:hypothetical protein
LSSSIPETDVPSCDRNAHELNLVLPPGGFGISSVISQLPVSVGAGVIVFVVPALPQPQKHSMEREKAILRLLSSFIYIEHERLMQELRVRHNNT